jgi:peptide/nickel transport system substrate-binding protein
MKVSGEMGFDAQLQLLQHPFMAGHLNRRDFIKRASVMGFSMATISAALAACGGGSSSTATTGSSATSGSSGGASTTPTTSITVNQNASPVASGGATPTGSTSSGPSGGSVILARGTDSDNLDPVTNDGNVNIWLFMNIYDQLITVANDGLSLTPDIAEKWDTSPDGKTFTFHIRSGVKFFDGSDMTVDDIKWSLERAQKTESSPWLFTLEQVDTIDSPDDSTVVITLKEAWAPFLADISMFNSSIISKAFGTKIGEDKLVDQTMGTGPFQLKEWKKAQSMTLVKNPNYWKPGLPKVDQITIPVVTDSNSRILQLKGGQVDGIIGQNDIPLSAVTDLGNTPNLKVYKFTSTYNNFIVLNTRNAPLNDVKVRQALNYATDKKEIIKSLLFGNAEVSNSFMPNGALFWNPDQKGYPVDVDQAKKLISESQSPNGFKLEFQVLSGNQLQLQTATALKDMWQAINVELDILQLEQGVMTDNYRNNKFQARLTGWTNDIIDPDELVSYAILPESTQNYHTGWTNQKAIDLANEGRTTLDESKRKDIYYQIQQIHMDDAPFVYLYVLPYIDALNTKVEGYFHHPMGQWVFANMSVKS